MKKAIAENEWSALKAATHSIIPTFATMGINLRFEDIAKDLQALAVLLIANDAGEEAGEQTKAQVLAAFTKIEAVCALAARELEEKLQRLSQTLPITRQHPLQLL